MHESGWPSTPPPSHSHVTLVWFQDLVWSKVLNKGQIRVCIRIKYILLIVKVRLGNTIILWQCRERDLHMPCVRALRQQLVHSPPPPLSLCRSGGEPQHSSLLTVFTSVRIGGRDVSTDGNPWVFTPVLQLLTRAAICGATRSRSDRYLSVNSCTCHHPTLTLVVPSSSVQHPDGQKQEFILTLSLWPERPPEWTPSDILDSFSKITNWDLRCWDAGIKPFHRCSLDVWLVLCSSLLSTQTVSYRCHR